MAYLDRTTEDYWDSENETNLFWDTSSTPDSWYSEATSTWRRLLSYGTWMTNHYDKIRIGVLYRGGQEADHAYMIVTDDDGITLFSGTLTCTWHAETLNIENDLNWSGSTSIAQIHGIRFQIRTSADVVVTSSAFLEIEKIELQESNVAVVYADECYSSHTVDNLNLNYMYTLEMNECYHTHSGDLTTLTFPVADKADIRFYKCATWTPGASHGGAINTDEEILNDVDSWNNVFTDFPDGDRAAGATFYRKVFVKNCSAHGSWHNTKLWFAPIYTGSTPFLWNTNISIVAGTNSDIQTAATGYTYVQPTDITHADCIVLGDLWEGQSKSFWLKLTYPAGTQPKMNETFIVVVSRQ